MTTIQFSTTTDDERTETGSFDGKTLETPHEYRPDFRIEDGDSVTMIAAQGSVVVEEFGENATIIDRNS